ncbi:L-serine ammonia-lyase, iron-sulfur-dependent, subunit alpha [Veillonella agrestimuris]|uniref:L-serine ammonia-lyase, iron-sulfur-dependent, subunit alpha n=1 Tax=Veillonella agrestimuris TaxID=2941340 RepID=UPI00203B4FBB|nr:L-serine ammonia-lyase, iron-sulfur-dependent, subunit alpha [Veillonella agrestimuris]
MSYTYETIGDILRLAEEHQISFGDVVIRHELEAYDRSEEEIVAEIKRRLAIFESSIQDGLNHIERTQSNMSGGDAATLHAGKPRLMSDIAYKAMTYAIAVNEANAKMFRIVACPTAGSCGVMPGAVQAVAEEYQLDADAMVKGFLASSGVGNVVANRACVAGAVGGCQAEIGTAACMAASAIVEMLGGTPYQVVQAIALGMKNLLGLACDPVAGLVEVPCVKRNGVYAVHAITAAELALAGIESQIPADDVIEAMNNIGRAMPAALRETSDGGLAVTPTGLAIAERVQSL